MGALWPVAQTRAAWAILALAIVAGVAAPALPTAMRRQWQQLLGREHPALAQAYAFEVNAQIAIFVLGPLLAAAGLSAIGAGATLAGTGLLLVVGAIGFAACSVYDQQAPVSSRGRRQNLLRRPGIATLVALTLAADTALGIVDIAVTAFAKGHRSPSAAGLLLGLAAFSAVIVGVLFGTRRWPAAPSRLLVGALAVAAVLTAPLALARSIPAMAGLLVVASAPLALQPIIVYQLLDIVAPHERAAEALAWISTANSAAVGAGYVVAGAIIQASGTTGAFLVSAAVLLLAAVIALSRRRTLGPAFSSPA